MTIIKSPFDGIMQQLLKTNKILIKILLPDLSNKYNGVDAIFLFKDN